ncbi:hypothetical protein GCM10027321_36130 [Massilia terrae]|uniref:YifB family Mg chelatase-like AAA ATPase n=1 Tax=Massilia terrae TaxID=1811224 RepID=A0ABT2D4U0_9BURK|nr:YifB family Mg chelatase-like AAA ATPase [Massilia terrae]MCS0660801.1 YifB family Mg chelatase-like AAA ATPase [Massilia terrae]
MSLAVLRSRALAGMEAPAVSVEVHLANGLPCLTIVGLPDAEVREAKDRVKAALQNAGFDIPARRITINLAPAELPKESGRFDLPIALGILAASRQIPSKELGRYEFAGELSLSGELRPVRGALAMAFAMQRGAVSAPSFILPLANADEAALVADAAIYPARTLLEVCAHFAAHDENGRLARHRRRTDITHRSYADFADVKGQLHAKRALEVAAAGLHAVLLIGPPGTGKSMLASRFPALLPPMNDEQALESAAVQSLAGSFSAEQWKQRPFRSPHHTSSGVALVGGGALPRPGEISLAHHGVLFLDELIVRCSSTVCLQACRVRRVPPLKPDLLDMRIQNASPSGPYSRWRSPLRSVCSTAASTSGSKPRLGEPFNGSNSTSISRMNSPGRWPSRSNASQSGVTSMGFKCGNDCSTRLTTFVTNCRSSSGMRVIADP